MDFATSALLSTAVAIGSWLMIGHSILIQVAFAQLQPLTVFLVNFCLSQDVSAMVVCATAITAYLKKYILTQLGADALDRCGDERVRSLGEYLL